MEIFFADTGNFPEIQGTKKEREHVLGRLLVKTAAERFYKISEPQIDIKNKKPYFKNSDLRFSISHSRNYVIAAFDYNPVGADIEFMKQRDFQAFSKRYNMNFAHNDFEKFYSFWTNYEAKIKLQDEVKSKFTFKFRRNFIISVASSKEQNIKSCLKIYELTNADVLTPSLINIPDEYILSSS